MSPEAIGGSLLLLAALVLVGAGVRLRVQWLQRLFIPASVIAGVLGLMVGPDVLGAAVRAFAGTEATAAGGLLPSEVWEVWSELPGLLISVVFAAMFIGRTLPPMRRIVDLGGPQIAFSFVLSAGQIMVGLLLAVFVLGPLFGLPPVAGALIEIGFVGGHGTAAGLEPAFKDAGFAEGTDLGLGLATIGVLSGILTGMALVTWAARTGRAPHLRAGDDVPAGSAVRPVDNRAPGAILTVRPAAVEPLALHLGLIGVAVLIGKVMLSGLRALEQQLWISHLALFETMPLFPLAMLGGVVVQLAVQRLDSRQVVDGLTVRRLQGLSLDLLIVSALATLSLSALAANFLPFLLLALAGLTWNIGMFLLLAPRIIPSHWFERAIGDLGQSFGVSATGLLLLRAADPDDRTPAATAFGYKQLGFEPFFGGGLVTATSVPLIAAFGPWALLLAMAAIVTVSAFVGVRYFGSRVGAETKVG